MPEPTPATQGINEHAPSCKRTKCTHRTQAACHYPKPPTSRASVTDPGASAIINIEHNADVAHALTTTTAAAAPCFIKVSPRELVALPLSVDTGTSLDFGLDGYHVVTALEEPRAEVGGPRGARLLSPLLLG